MTDNAPFTTQQLGQVPRITVSFDKNVQLETLDPAKKFQSEKVFISASFDLGEGQDIQAKANELYGLLQAAMKPMLEDIVARNAPGAGSIVSPSDFVSKPATKTRGFSRRWNTKSSGE